MNAIVELNIPAPDNAPMVAAEAALAAVNGMTITSQADLSHAADELKAIKARATELEAKRKELVSPLNEAHARIQALFKQPMQFLADAEKIIKSKILGYTNEQQRLAREAAAAEEARLRKLAEQRAVRAEKRGDDHAAIEHRETAELTVVPVAAPPAVSGISARSLWRAELVDLRVLCRAISEGKAPASLVTLNQTEANRIASSLKETMQIPGLRPVESQTIAARR